MNEILTSKPEIESQPDNHWEKALENIEGVLKSRSPEVDQDLIEDRKEILKQMSEASELKFVHNVYHRQDGSVDEYRGVWLPWAETPAGGMSVDELVAMLGTAESSDWFALGGVPESEAYRMELTEALGKSLTFSSAEFDEKETNKKFQPTRKIARKVLSILSVR